MIYHNVHDNKAGVFNAASGKLIDINKPTVDMICIDDIAASLSKICRFGGHSNEFYSVAQHSIFVMALAPEYLCREALLHDAAEAYLGDVIKPLKNLLGIAYEELESDFMKCIIRKFNLDASRLLEVKQYDKTALAFEHKRFIVDDRDEWFEAMRGVTLNPSAWRHEYAQSTFLKLYKLIFLL